MAEKEMTLKEIMQYQKTHSLLMPPPIDEMKLKIDTIEKGLKAANEQIQNLLKLIVNGK